MAIGNLVEGGARRGVFTTRRQRLVRVLRPFQFSEPAAPGKAPETRTCWEAMRYMADGHTEDGMLIYEQSGAIKSTNGAPNQPDDLVSIVSLDPDAPEVLALESAEVPASQVADYEGRIAQLEADNKALRAEVGHLREWKRARKAAAQQAVANV